MNGILGPSQPPHLLAQLASDLGVGQVVDDQDLERRRSASVGLARWPDELTLVTVSVSPHRGLVVARVAQRADLLQLAAAGEGPVGLERVQQQHQLADLPCNAGRWSAGVRASDSRFVTSASEVQASPRSRHTLV